MDWTTAKEFTDSFGVPVAGLIIFTLAIVSTRKRNGHHKSAFLVPGWVHDHLRDELEAVRSVYQARELEAKLESERVAKEWRELYEFERSRCQDLDNRFREVNALRQKDSAMIDELRREQLGAQKRRPQPRSTDANAKT